MRVLFHANTLNYRGTTVAITDYAKYNQEILGNESVIAYNDSLGYEKDMGSEQAVVEELRKKFNVVGYREGDLEGIVQKEKIDFAYFIRAGFAEPLPMNVRTGVHSVFQYNEPHGDKYAYVSKWLSEHMSQGTIPYVPHIVRLPTPTRDYREVLGIRKDQVVLGRYGGYFTFDIPFVQDTIRRIISETDHFVFLFMGTNPFIDHPCVKYVTETHDLQKKANFINTCDGMLHARTRGESFGLSIAEFLALNKPVLAWEGGGDRNHVDMLGDSDLLYNENDLYEKITHIKSLDRQQWYKRVYEYTPGVVMNKFDEVFLK